jgi:plastocyanin
MRSVRSLIIIFITLSLNPGFAQTTHNVALVGNTFSPGELTIKVNDVVRWTNNGGLHNVVADDNSFSSGNASTAIWVFEHTFDTEGTYGYHCTEHGGPGFGMFGTIIVEGPTDVKDDLVKADYQLHQNYPNPFNPKTIIEYSIPESGNVVIKVFNVTGALERTIISKYHTSGNYSVEFNSEGLSSGIYFYQLIAGDFINTKRMILLK